ncbi:MAG: 3-phosphoshikimate 1-carboxyvinyltransferase [Muribaculaceae bacterium]|nr:3-phosphoshikimate 1-carboxyvinyltransferase [Muribaculaceae bacterium]
MILLPPSKSIAARYLVASFFSGTLPGDPLFEDNDDLMVLQSALLEVYSDEEPIDYGDSPIDCGESGTALRFLTAVCASSPGADYVITGSPRLMQRPMLPLLKVLREVGAHIETLGDNETGPYRVGGNRLKGGNFSIRGDISSQFISALMLAAPYWQEGMNLSFSTPLVSQPYINMTARLMESFKAKVKLTDSFVEVKPGKYEVAKDFKVEADWSSAAFFMEACALSGSPLEIEKLTPPDSSLQGDSAAAGIFSKIGVVTSFDDDATRLKYDPSIALREVEIDFKETPDLVLPVAVGCLLTGVKFRFTNVAHLRFKESDRILSLVNESAKIGFVIKSDDNTLEWQGERVEPQKSPLIKTYDDHRVAMAFAMTVFKTGEIRIEHPEVVEKSFIDFWNQLAKLGVSLHQEGEIMIVKK